MTVSFLYKRYEEKLERENNTYNYNAIQDYLLDGERLEKSKKPILWIHVPYEYNSRNWLSFGSRSSLQLNQPYLYLTVRSILKHCDQSFTVCFVDDNSLKKLIPDWNIDMTKLSDPILSNMRALGMMKLLYIYGGLICPLSFLCMKDLISMYSKGTRNNKMFVCEMVDRNSTSVKNDLYPSIQFCGAKRECKTVEDLCHYIQIISSNDFTAESKFLGQYDRWCMKKIEEGKINYIPGVEIGTKTLNDKVIVLDDLMSNHYLDLYTDTYGIFIPSNELLNRLQFGWFVRMSPRQVLESNTIIGNYLLLSMGPKEEGVLEPLKIAPNWISFWKTPLSAPVWGLKPSHLGNHVNRQGHP
jgi:hypothetical protein